MSDYISREAASAVIEGEQKKLCPVGLWGRKFAADADKYDILQEMLDKLEAIPTVDVEPVQHGRWIEDHDYLKCPKCGVMVMRDFTFFDIGDWNFCPNCGTKMDLEEK